MSSHSTSTDTGGTSPQTGAKPSGWLDRYFDSTARGSPLSREIRGGVVTFFTMAYIVVLNPLIVGTPEDVNGNSLGVPQVAAATALVAGVMTILMGVVANYPFSGSTPSSPRVWLPR